MLEQHPNNTKVDICMVVEMVYQCFAWYNAACNNCTDILALNALHQATGAKKRIQVREDEKKWRNRHENLNKGTMSIVKSFERVINSFQTSLLTKQLLWKNNCFCIEMSGHPWSELAYTGMNIIWSCEILPLFIRTKQLRRLTNWMTVFESKMEGIGKRIGIDKSIFL